MILKSHIYIRFLLWISLQDTKTILKGLNDLFEHISALSDCLGLTKGFSNLLLRIDTVVKLELELFLRHSHEEVTNLLGDGVSHIA